jgi:hypothetical protein
MPTLLVIAVGKFWDDFENLGHSLGEMLGF